MKKILILLILAVSASCSNKDDSSEENLLTGEWYLSEVECFCAGSPPNLEESTLRFDPNKNVIYIYNPPENPDYLAETGSYEYILDEDILIINGEAFQYEISSSALILTFVDEPGIADDELVLRYNRE